MNSIKNRITLFGFAAAALAVVWYFLVYCPTAQCLKVAHDDIDEAQLQLADFNRTMAELPEYLQADQNLQVLRHELNSSLYAKDDIVELFRQIVREANDYGLRLVQITPPVSELLELNRQASAENNPLFLNVTLDFRGEYLDFGRFVTRLETQPYFREATACHIRGQQTPSPVLDLSLSFRALLGSVEAAS
ncbi:MAG: hypothetical protein AB1772_05300 [Candidatus Zixiibacteriota bacterium]